MDENEPVSAGEPILADVQLHQQPSTNHDSKLEMGAVQSEQEGGEQQTPDRSFSDLKRAAFDSEKAPVPALPEPDDREHSEENHGERCECRQQPPSVGDGAEDDRHKFDFPQFLQSLQDMDGSVDDALDAIVHDVADIDHLIALADLYNRPSGRADAIRRVLQTDPEKSSLDRLHIVATRKSCLDSMLVLAEADHVLSQHSVALMFSERQRPAEFETWLWRAADAGHVLSMMGMVSLLSQRDPQRSFSYARRAADHGLRAAQYIVGRCLIMGHGVGADFQAGLEYVVKAADAGMSEAQVLAGGIFIQEHHGVAADPEKALQYFKKAAEQDNAEALYILGSLLMSGQSGLDANREEGVRLIRRAAEAGNPRAQLDLGKMYNAGEYFTEDFQEGFAWCLQAALHGVPMAAFIIGIMHLEGMGCERNILAGCHWIERASILNHAEARKMLATLLSDPKISEAFDDWKMTQSLLKIMMPSLRVNLAALS